MFPRFVEALIIAPKLVLSSNLTSIISTQPHLETEYIDQPLLAFIPT